MTYHRPTFISERELAALWVDGRSQDDARWEDCANCSVGMQVDAMTGGAKPGAKTLDEAERLRFAAGYGPLGGTDIARLARAAVGRYGIPAPRVVSGFALIWAALTPGKGAAIAGDPVGLPAGHRLRRFQPGFVGGHSVYVQREDNQDRVWWMDPLGPKDGSYRGEWATKEELRRFLNAGGALAVVGSVAQAPAPKPATPISVPAQKPAAPVVAPKPTPKPRRAFYTVKSGDTLSEIATRYKTTLAALLAFPENKPYRANPALILPGQRVRVK